MLRRKSVGRVESFGRFNCFVSFVLVLHRIWQFFLSFNDTFSSFCVSFESFHDGLTVLCLFVSFNDSFPSFVCFLCLLMILFLCFCVFS